ncbi:MAG: hypothetical protein ACR2RE_03355 [Geminicoccaceae bacterium]
MPTYGNVAPPKGFMALVKMLEETGKTYPFSLANVPDDRLKTGASLLDEIHSEFDLLKRFYTYKSDPEGKDIWQPLRIAKAPIGSSLTSVLVGDCEDWCLTFIVWLLGAGIPRGAMSIITCELHDSNEIPISIGHAVVAVETTETTLICDSTLNKPMPWDAPIFRGEVPGFNAVYEWISRQKPGQEHWVSCRPPPTLSDVVDEIEEKKMAEEQFVVCLNLHARAAAPTQAQAEELAATRLAFAAGTIDSGRIPTNPGVEFFKNHGGGGGPCEPRFRRFDLPVNAFGLPEAKQKP